MEKYLVILIRQLTTNDPVVSEVFEVESESTAIESYAEEIKKEAVETFVDKFPEFESATWVVHHQLLSSIQKYY